ncbi:hypothetical protein SEVIR_1G348801v4 [Setaria viridis]
MWWRLSRDGMAPPESSSADCRRRSSQEPREKRCSDPAGVTMKPGSRRSNWELGAIRPTGRWEARLAWAEVRHRRDLETMERAAANCLIERAPMRGARGRPTCSYGRSQVVDGPLRIQNRRRRQGQSG